ncbi:type II toxin-antitoxin system PemK/MazF family toxin [Rickettsiales endosymbiont of Stachyamoeba lipophora]|uniref:type II toxin-antitoxin system PemK/MazF family toxin n=1 Tax=Rickettsiales endosymbiont of Stachyamoeba lipophora TaxID=2486578 RepID=UPI0013DE3FF9|nr:type II toxin-antitoxin system PemK/MazF family toxin [Rickettsiales endosymbiont of Stachyamoeba lipophora]
MIYNQFDIVKIPFPFNGNDNTKNRPAIVISSTTYQINNNNAILAMITSLNQSKWLEDIPLTNLERTGLSSPSKIRLKLFTLDQRFIINKIGELAALDRFKLQKHLKQIMLP